jgi:DNA repair exonuclease SbcCD ATPase subunit
MGTDMSIQFKINVEDNGLDLKLIEDSGIERQLPQFSFGQSNRIGLATGLALRDLSLYSNIDFGFTMFDEVLDGLDERGIEMFFEIIQGLKGRKFIISHDNNLKNYFQHYINIVRKNHKSNIYVKY